MFKAFVKGFVTAFVAKTVYYKVRDTVQAQANK